MKARRVLWDEDYQIELPSASILGYYASSDGPVTNQH